MQAAQEKLRQSKLEKLLSWGLPNSLLAWQYSMYWAPGLHCTSYGIIYVVFFSNVIPVRDITLGNILELLQLVFYMSCHFYGTIFSLLEGFVVPVPDLLMRRLTAGFSHSCSWMGHHFSHCKSQHFIYPKCYPFWDVAVGQGIWKAGSSLMGYSGGLLLFLTTALCLHSSWYVKLIQSPRTDWSWRMQLSMLFRRNEKMGHRVRH